MKTNLLPIIKIIKRNPLKYSGVWISGILTGTFLQLKWINDHCGGDILNLSEPLAKDNMIRLFAGGPVFLIILFIAFILCALFVMHIVKDDHKNERILLNLNNVFYGFLLIVFAPVFKYSNWYFIFIAAAIWFLFFKSMNEFIIQPMKYHKYLVLTICVFISYEVLESAENINFITGGKSFAKNILNGLPGKILEPYAGMEGLPKPVSLVISGLRINNIQNFLSVGEFVGNPLFAQRIVEGAWPKQHTSESKYRVGFIKDLKAVKNFYKIIWEKENVGIAVLKN